MDFFIFPPPRSIVRFFTIERGGGTVENQTKQRLIFRRFTTGSPHFEVDDVSLTGLATNIERRQKRHLFVTRVPINTLIPCLR